MMDSLAFSIAIAIAIVALLIMVAVVVVASDSTERISSFQPLLIRSAIDGGVPGVCPVSASKPPGGPGVEAVILDCPASLPFC